MKSLLAFILLLSFVATAVFGVFGMHAFMQNHEGGCVAAATQAADCPRENNSLGYLAFHLNAYKRFSLATPGENAAAALLSAFVMLLLIGLAFFSLWLFGSPRPAFCKHRFKDSFSHSQKQALARWLAFHENSPAGLFGTLT